MRILNHLLHPLSRFLVRRSCAWQRRSPLGDPALWGLAVSSAGHLSVSGIDTLDLVERYGSPLLVVHRSQLVEDCREVVRALAPAPQGSQVLYSYKTNSTPGILEVIHEEGVGAEVISPYELWLAEKLQVPGERIVYNGVGKTEESIRRAISLNVLAINIDHVEELDLIHRVARSLGRKARVGVRLGLASSSQLGLDVPGGEALEVCRRLASLGEHLELTCLHFNVVSNAKSPEAHTRSALEALEFLATVKSRLGVTVPLLDIGGGFGVPTTKNMTGREYALYRLLRVLPRPPSPDEMAPMDRFLGAILDAVGEFCASRDLRQPAILIEPGRRITSRAELLLTRVHSVKRRTGGPDFVLTDAGRLTLTFPAEFQYHEMFLAGRPTAERTRLYHVMGRLCTSADWLVRNRLLPEVRAGDVLAVMDAGAYFSSCSTNFAFPRPAVVMVEDGRERVIRREEPFEHLVGPDGG